jgi:hypothetical protein
MSQAGIINPSGMPAVPTTFVTDSGNATPALNVINIVTPGGGTTGISTSGAGNTITITLTDTSISGTGQTIGAVTADVITFPLGAVPGNYVFDVKVTGFESTTPAGASYTIEAGVTTTGAAAVLLPNQVPDEMEAAVLIPADASVTVAGNNMIVRVTGVAGLTITWKAVAEFIFIG